MGRVWLCCLSLSGLLLASVPVPATERQVTILHTNDWQSRLLGAGPVAEYSPLSLGDDSTIGGVARLASLIRERRRVRSGGGPVFVFDGGDYSMGTLFHWLTRSTGSELQLMKALGYDATTLGNHEFDIGLQGLAESINAALAGSGAPTLLASNMRFNSEDSGDDGLEALFAKGHIQPYKIIDRGGVRVGVVGVLGVAAYRVLQTADPLQWVPPAEAVAPLVRLLREHYQVDLVVALSHGGIWGNAEDGWVGDDIDLVKAVPGIDLLVGGHSHTSLPEPLWVDGTPIVQAGSDTRYLGELVLALTDTGVEVRSYRLHLVDDRIPGDLGVVAVTDRLVDRLDREYLNPQGLSFYRPLLEAPRDFARRAKGDRVLGNFIGDALREAARVDIAFTSNALVRDDLYRGKTGLTTFADLYRILPLGYGDLGGDLGGDPGGEPGYPLVRGWMTGADIKFLLEMSLAAHNLLGISSYPEISGTRITYNPYRVPLDQIRSIEIGDLEGGFKPMDLLSDRLYSVATTGMEAAYWYLPESISGGLLRIMPRRTDGSVVTDAAELIIDGDPEAEGVQEIKAWRALLDHLQVLPDLNGDGIPEMPDTRFANQQRILREASLAPARYLYNISMPSLVLFGFFLCLLAYLLARLLVRRRRHWAIPSRRR